MSIWHYFGLIHVYCCSTYCARLLRQVLRVFSQMAERDECRGTQIFPFTRIPSSFLNALSRRAVNNFSDMASHCMTPIVGNPQTHSVRPGSMRWPSCSSGLGMLRYNKQALYCMMRNETFTAFTMNDYIILRVTL